MLRKLGASLAQAQAAMASVADEGSSATHPGRAPRLTAIGQGWQRAESQIAASRQALAPSAAPALLADAAPTDDTQQALAALHPSASPQRVKLVGQLTFRDQPEQRFYLTSALKVVRVDADNLAEEVGHLTHTSSRTFPYVLTDDKKHNLFVTPGGDVYDKEGQRVAKLI